MTVDVLLIISSLGVVALALNGDYRAIRNESRQYTPPIHMALAVVLLLGTESTGTIALIGNNDTKLEIIRIFVNLCGWVVLWQLRRMVRERR